MNRFRLRNLLAASVASVFAAGVACGPTGGGGDGGADGATEGGEDATSEDSAVDGTIDAPVDAISDSALDAGGDVAGEASVDGSTDAIASDATSDASDATSDASDASSTVCGDGIRDPLTEECDDGVISTNPDSCTSVCTVRDLLAWRTPTDASATERTLGLGRHPVGADANGFAVAWVEPASPDVFATFYDEKGVPAAHVDHVGVSSSCLTTSAPVLAAVAGKYAAAWTDYGGDGDGEGVAIRLVDPSTSSSGAPAHANQTTSLAQYHPDILWTGSEVVVAWEDTSNSSTGPDIRYRTFSSTLSPTSTEQTLTATSAFEQDVALAVFGAGWAAAWRSASGGTESIEITTSASVAWSVGPFLPGPYDSAPALAQLDSTHMLLVYTEGLDTTDAGVANESIIRGALLDTSAPGSVTAFDITTITTTDAGTTPSTYFPNAVAVGSRVFVAWGTGAMTSDPNGEEPWLKEIGWSGTTLDMTLTARTLPRWDAHRVGDQRLVALAASPLGPSGAIASAWFDLGNGFSGEANGDVVVELLPVPVLRISTADGGGL